MPIYPPRELERRALPQRGMRTPSMIILPPSCRAGGLATTSQLVFVDFDAAEKVIVKAYDLANHLILFASTSVPLSAGADSTPRFDDIEWASFAGATGRLHNIVEDDESRVVASINSTTSIARLLNECDMNPDNDVSNPTIRFSFAAVPEPSTYCMALAGIACGGYLVRRLGPPTGIDPKPTGEEPRACRPQ